MGLWQARRLVGQTKIVERSAELIPGVVYKRNDAALEAQPAAAGDEWNRWWDQRLIETWKDVIEPTLAEAIADVRNEMREEIEKLRAEIDELKKQRDAS
jgi:hypothetical protein